MEPKHLMEFLPLREEFTECITSSGLDPKFMAIFCSFKLFPELS